MFIVQGNLQGNPLFRDGGKQWMYEPEWASLKQYPHVCVFRVSFEGEFAPLPPIHPLSLNFPLCHSGVYMYIAPSLAGQMFGGLREYLVTFRDLNLFFIKLSDKLNKNAWDCIKMMTYAHTDQNYTKFW